MAAAWISSRKIVPTLASAVMRRWETTRTVLVSTQERLLHHCINGQHVRRWAAVEKRKYFIPHARRYGTSLFSAREMKKLGRATGEYNYDLAVDKAIQHYHKHIKEEGDGQNIMMYPVRGATECLSGVNLFHILLKTTRGQKYISIYLAPEVDPSTKLDDGALKLMFFRKLDNNIKISLPFREVVGEIGWPVCPRNDPLITAVARFALAQHNKEEKLAHLIRATSQMVSENEIFKMTFKGEFSDISTMYDAIVLVPRKNPEKMELVMIKKSDGWGMYGRLRLYLGSKLIVPRIYPLRRYKYDSDSDSDYDYDYEPKSMSASDGKYVYQYEDDGCVVDDPRVTVAARFALALYNETDQVRLGNKKDQIRRVVEATRRMYMGDEVLNMIFDGELDGSWSYHAIVLVPVNDPENMRLAYCGRDYDDPDPYIDDYERGDRWGIDSVNEMFDSDEDGSDEDEDGFGRCSIDDPRVIEAARLALATHIKKDKLIRVVKVTRRIDARGETYTMRFVGEDHPLRTFVGIVLVSVNDPQRMQVEYVSRFP